MADLVVEDHWALSRIRKRLLRLETDLAVALAELDQIIARGGHKDFGKEIGRELSTGIDRLFTPKGLAASVAVVPYKKYADTFWFSWDKSKDAQPVIRVWQSSIGSSDPAVKPDRVSLNVDIREQAGHNWLLMEFPIDWAAIEKERQLGIAITAYSSVPINLPVSIYADTRDKNSVLRGYQVLSIGDIPQMSIANVTLDDEYFAQVDRSKPAKLHFHLDKVKATRLELLDLKLFAPRAI
jgi:hypothetical protein